MKTLILFLLTLSASGQSLIKDICLGPCPSTPKNLTTIGSTMYFSASNGQSGQELWKTNGTSAGTVLIKDIRPGNSGSLPSQFTLSNGKVFFVADNGVNGAELWKTDGTAVGTALVKDVWPGINGSGISKLTAVGNVLYFVANDGVHGLELWKSDGTTAGTVLLRDFKSGIADGGIQSMVNFQNKLVFARTFYSPESCQLWQYDPTVNKFSIKFGVAEQYIDHLTSHGGNLYYAQGSVNEFVSVYRMNADQKGGSWFYEVESYYLTWVRSQGGKLWVAAGDEFLPLIVRGLDAAGNVISNIGDGVSDMATLGINTYFASNSTGDYTSYDNDVYKVFKNVPYVSPLASFKGWIREVEVLGNQLLFTAYTSANGSELRAMGVSGAREGILEEEETSTLAVFPNPASSKVTVEADGLVEICDMMGHSFFEAEMKPETGKTIQIDTFPAGMYVVRVRNGEYQQVRKLVVER